ncbi:lipase (secreted protein) [Marssonina coronariae]|uniref:Lipase (Secreted protein) n=1 Tax=Diplocarpon coronariae TaxID=2795749 RepID=A0A218YWH6_9HELO|nr:lipase (secreted protein) [Marssonina coronariae]
MFSHLPAAVLVASLLACPAVDAATNTSAPLARVKNGTYAGKTVAEWQQDLFLGIPYAIPPVGDLRFARPKSLDTAFPGIRNATEYGFSCYQYSDPNFTLSEDCLTVNVLRPAGTSENEKLPVLVWVHGGGFYAGSSADPQYNVSGLTHVGQEIGKPMITVSFNYRLGVWGFLQTPQLLAEGNTNAGLLDQRMAFRWIKENIAAFGGDPARITLWGESVGAQCIAFHLLSYDGRDDNLFQAAILESGGPTGAQLQPLSYYTAHTETLMRTANCSTATDQLACLRGISSEDLWKARVTTLWNPLVDGDILTAYPSTLMAQGKFIRLPILAGANTDEGSTFSAYDTDNDTSFFHSMFSYRSYAIAADTARRLMELYPNDMAAKPPYGIVNTTVFPNKPLQWRRSAAMNGDIVMISGRRKFCEVYAAAGQAVYSYRFDTPLWNAAITEGAWHFANVVFSFQNISGALGPLPQFQNYTKLSRDIGRAYVSFVHDHDPNTSNGDSTLPPWPRYDLASPENLVLNSNRSFTEPDTWRKEGIDFINSIAKQLWA